MFIRNFQDKQQQVLKKIQALKAFYADFRLYDLASITINGLTSKKGYQFQSNIAYGLKARQRLRARLKI